MQASSDVKCCSAVSKSILEKQINEDKWVGKGKTVAANNSNNAVRINVALSTHKVKIFLDSLDFR